MARLTKEQIARNDGMNYALKIAEEEGIDGLRTHCSMRGILNIGDRVDYKQLQNAKIDITIRTVDIIRLFIDYILTCNNFEVEDIKMVNHNLDELVARVMVNTEDRLDDLINYVYEKTGIMHTIGKGLDKKW